MVHKGMKQTGKLDLKAERSQQAGGNPDDVRAHEDILEALNSVALEQDNDYHKVKMQKELPQNSHNVAEEQTKALTENTADQRHNSLAVDYDRGSLWQDMWDCWPDLALQIVHRWVDYCEL